MPEEEEEKVEETVESVAAFLSRACIAHTRRKLWIISIKCLICTAYISHPQFKSRKLYLLHQVSTFVVLATVYSWFDLLVMGHLEIS